MAKENRGAQKSLSPADRERFLRAKRGYEDIPAYQITQWVSRTRYYTHLVAAGNVRPEIVSVFWTGVYGVMVDVRRHVDDLRATLISLNEPVLKRFGLDASQIRYLDAIVESIDRLHGAFDQDELEYLEYRRHVECHPLQHAYEITVRNGAIIDRTRKLTNRAWSFEDEDAAVRRVLRKHGRMFPSGPDETPIARVFAERVDQLLPPLEESLCPIFGTRHFSWGDT